MSVEYKIVCEWPLDVERELNELAAKGWRVAAVGSGPYETLNNGVRQGLAVVLEREKKAPTL